MAPSRVYVTVGFVGDLALHYSILFVHNVNIVIKQSIHLQMRHHVTQIHVKMVANVQKETALPLVYAL